MEAREQPGFRNVVVVTPFSSLQPRAIASGRVGVGNQLCRVGSMLQPDVDFFGLVALAATAFSAPHFWSATLGARHSRHGDYFRRRAVVATFVLMPRSALGLVAIGFEAPRLLGSMMGAWDAVRAGDNRHDAIGRFLLWRGRFAGIGSSRSGPSVHLSWPGLAQGAFMLQHPDGLKAAGRSPRMSRWRSSPARSYFLVGRHSGARLFDQQRARATKH